MGNLNLNTNTNSTDDYYNLDFLKNSSNNNKQSGNNNSGLGIQITGVAGASPGGVDQVTGLDKTLTGANSMFTFDVYVY